MKNFKSAPAAKHELDCCCSQKLAEWPSSVECGSVQGVHCRQSCLWRDQNDRFGPPPPDPHATVCAESFIRQDHAYYVRILLYFVFLLVLCFNANTLACPTSFSRRRRSPRCCCCWLLLLLLLLMMMTMISDASWTRFHQDGNGTVDSGHQCLAGRNRVIMLRRLDNEEDKHAALNILSGGAGGGKGGGVSAGAAAGEGGNKVHELRRRHMSLFGDFYVD